MLPPGLEPGQSPHLGASFRRHGYKPCVLPIKLKEQNYYINKGDVELKLTTTVQKVVLLPLNYIRITHHTGFEPVTFTVTGRRALRCSNGAKFYEWNLLDLNQRPHAYQACALTI